MSEKEFMIEKMYEKHKVWQLPLGKAAKEWGSSASTVNKLFGGAKALPDKTIKKINMIPAWIMVGKRKKWPLASIADWVLNTQNV